MNLIADQIIANEERFLNEYGYWDKQYICESFNLSSGEWLKLKKLID